MSDLPPQSNGSGLSEGLPSAQLAQPNPAGGQGLLLEALIELSPEAIFITDVNGVLIQVNAGACQLLGYCQEALLGNAIATLATPVTSSQLATPREPAVFGNHPVSTWIFWHSDGSTIPTEVSAKVLSDGRWVAFVRDLRECFPLQGGQLAERALREKEQQWQHLSDSMPQFVWIRDALGDLQYVNRRWCEYSGLTLEQSRSLAQRVECYHPEDREGAFGKWAIAQETKQPFEFETRLKRASDGAYRWFLVRGVPVLDPRKQLLYWHSISTDIHERKLVELNERFLSGLDLRLRHLCDADEMMWEAVSSIGQYLEVERCVWHEVDVPADITIVKQDWRRQADTSSVVGVHSLSKSILPEMIDDYHAGRPAIVSDVATHPHTAPFAQSFAEQDIRSFVGVPCLHEGRWVAVLAINARTVQSWRPDQVALLQETVARLWSVIEQTRSAQALQERSSHIQLLYETSRDLLRANQPLALIEALFAKLKTLVGLDVFFNYVLNEERQQLHLAFYGGISSDTARQIEWLDMDCTICGMTARQRRQIVQFDMQHSNDPISQFLRSLGLSAYACQPLIAQGKFLGILNFGSRSRTTFTLAESNLFQALCDQIAIALERSQLIASLQQQTEELLRNNRLKDEFFSVLSHELRTPLNPILGWTEVLRTQKLPPDKITHALQIIHRNIEQQIRLVDDLLDTSRAIQGKMPLKILPVDLASTVKAAVETIQFSVQAKAITLRLNSTTPIYTLGDHDRLQQVFWNLLSNAIKFTPEGGQIDIELSLVEEHSSPYAQVCITDTGIGISPQFLPHIFEYFRQEESGFTRSYSGLGLGLPLVHHLVELHGGIVTAQSPGLGQGSRFMVKLPLLKHDNSPEPNPVGRQMTPSTGDSQSPSESSNPSSSESSSSSMASTVAGRLTGVHIVLVDDEPDNLELLEFILSEAGATVVTFTSPAEALKAIIQSPPDLLISDIGMPEMNGYEFIQQIRALPDAQGGKVTAIALTAFAQPADQQRALLGGYQAYIVKPIDPHQIILTIAQWLP